MKHRPAWPGQQLERRDRLQIQPAGHRKSGSRLIGTQGKFHCWAIQSVNLFVIKAATGERYLRGKDHIALHGGRGSFEWRANKDVFWRRFRRLWFVWVGFVV